jgi:hypothetical protein
MAKKKTKKKIKPKSKRIDSPAENKTKRINVNFEDEINFIVDDIREGKQNNVVVTIPSGSDLLISTVSLELMAEVADKEGKKIVIVTDDEGGRSLAKTVGVTVRSNVKDVDDEVWKEAVTDAKKRKMDMENRKEWASDTSGEGPDLVPVDASSPLDELGATQTHVQADLEVREDQRDSRLRPDTRDYAEAGSMKPVDSEDLVQSGTKKVNLGDFEMTVDTSPIGESKNEDESMSSQIKPEVKKSESRRSSSGKGFVGRDFSNYKITGMDKKEKDELQDQIKPLGAVTKSKKAQRDSRLSSASPRQSADKDGGVKPLKDRRTKKKLINFDKLKAAFSGPGKWKKILIIVGVLFVLLSGGAYGTSRILPEALVTLEIDSISVEYDGEITASIDEDDIDEDDLVVPAKIKTVKKNGSDSAETTGVEERGDKATGTVLIFNKYIEEEIVLNAGTIIRNGGLNFVLQNSVVLDPVTLENPATMGESEVTAQEIGSEYNLSSGTQFSVGDYEVGDVYATNTDSFGGGSSEEYSVVTADDINNIVEDIQETLNEEAENDLKNEAENSRWVVVEDSIEHELSEDATSSAPAGAEADNIDVSIKTESKILYYDSNKLDELIENLLMEDFDGQIEDIELSDNVEKTIEIKSFDLDEGTVTLSVSVEGYVMPQLDKDKIQSSLSGKSWTDGIKYLEDMDYVSEEYELKYFPEWMPEFLWRMPSSKDKIRVKVNNVAPEDEESETSTDQGEDNSE